MASDVMWNERSSFTPHCRCARPSSCDMIDLTVFSPVLSLLQHVKTFSSSDSLAKVQEVASWLLEMNQDLLSGGSSSRRSRGSGGPAARGNASSSAAQAPQQPAEEADEDEHMNRVLEDEERPRQQVTTTKAFHSKVI